MKSRLVKRQRGLSLVEVMVSLVIGLVVIGVVLSTYISSGVGGRNSSAMAQITEDATVALNVMRAQIEMAGFSRPASVNESTGGWDRIYNGRGIVGCDNGFDDVTGVLDALVGNCEDEGTSDAIAIEYEADARTAIVTGEAPPRPADCLGDGLTEVEASGGVPAHFIASNRFYVTNQGDGGPPALYCRGNGAGRTQALIENIVALQFTYGVATEAEPRQAARYVSASNVGTDEWKRVVAVRVCVLVQSADNVMDEVTPYFDCDGAKQTPADGDRKMYRAFHSTVVLHNRLGVTK